MQKQDAVQKTAGLPGRTREGLLYIRLHCVKKVGTKQKISGKLTIQLVLQGLTLCSAEHDDAPLQDSLRRCNYFLCTSVSCRAPLWWPALGVCPGFQTIPADSESS